MVDTRPFVDDEKQPSPVIYPTDCTCDETNQSLLSRQRTDTMTNEIPDNHSETLPMQANSRMPVLHRVGLVAAGVIGITLLVVAFRLKPNPKGYGTHQQLGFSRCSFIEFFGIPCPSCGMTTSWSNLMNGRIIQSFRANPGGALLGICTLIVAPWILISGLIGKWVYKDPNMAWLFFGTLGICAVTTIQWLFRVTFFPL